MDNLSKTRIRDDSRGQVLTFKHIEWQTLRFVAKSEAVTEVGHAPLRLIANQAKCRVTLKKNMSDSSVCGARIAVIFDNLLWVLTDSQLLSALHFADYLGELIKKAPRTKKPFDVRANPQARNKLAAAAASNNVHGNSPNKMTGGSNSITNEVALLFSQFDMVETSHHLVVKHLEIHLMDVIGPQSVSSHCPDLSEGGALTITLSRILIDIYPNHPVTGAGASRKHWWRWNDPSPNRHSFVQHKIQCFYSRQQAQSKKDGFNLQQIYGHLSSQVVMIRLSEYSVGCVSTNNRVRNRDRTEVERVRLVSFDSTPVLPGNIDPIYIELNSYFYTEPFDRLAFPVPDATIFAHIASIKVVFEPLTLLWLNAFFGNLHNAMMKLKEAFPPAKEGHKENVNLRAEILMPTLVVALPEDIATGMEYSALEVKLSRILFYNCDSHIPMHYYKTLDELQRRMAENYDFFFDKVGYPWLGYDMKSVASDFMGKINRILAPNSMAAAATAGDETAADFWCLLMEPVWVELKVANTNRYEAFLEPLNVRLWLDVAPEDAADVELHMNVFVDIVEPVKVQLTHGHLMFLLRLLESIGDFTSMLNYDTYMIQRSHFIREEQRKNGTGGGDGVGGLSFDKEEEMINKIFKKVAIAGNIPEVNLFLVLKRTEIYEEDEDGSISTTSNTSLLLPSPGSSNGSNCNLLLMNLSNGHESPAGGGGGGGAADSAFNETEVNSLETMSLPPENGSVNHLTNGGGGGGEMNDIVGVARGIEVMSVGETITPPSGLKNSATMPEHDKLTRKANTITSLHSFDSSSVRIHYSAEDDALSTLSDDLDNDDSDQQSLMGALLGVDCTDTLDDLFVEEAVEAGEEMMYNETKDNNNGEDTLNDVMFGKRPASRKSKKLKTVLLDVLRVDVKQLSLVQQSSKGFLSQVMLDTTDFQLQELDKLSDDEYQNMFRVKIANKDTPPETKTVDEKAVDDRPKESNASGRRLTLRIDSFSKGTLRDEMISVKIKNLAQSLNKVTIDAVVDFFNDPYADKVAPTAVLLEAVQIQIIDPSMRISTVGLQVPWLKLAREKDNKWVIELDSTLGGGKFLFCGKQYQFSKSAFPFTEEQLLLRHLKVFQRNLLCNVSDLIREQDRLRRLKGSKANNGRSSSPAAATTSGDESQQILEQVLSQKDLLLQEVELLKKENEELRARLNL